MCLLAYYQLQLYIPLHGAILLLSVLSLRNQLQHYAGMIHDVPEQLFPLACKNIYTWKYESQLYNDLNGFSFAVAFN